MLTIKFPILFRRSIILEWRSINLWSQLLGVILSPSMAILFFDAVISCRISKHQIVESLIATLFHELNLIVIPSIIEQTLYARFIRSKLLLMLKSALLTNENTKRNWSMIGKVCLAINAVLIEGILLKQSFQFWIQLLNLLCLWWLSLLGSGRNLKISKIINFW